MLGKKEQAEALGSDPFTRFSEFEFLGQILWAESRSVWRKLTAGCKNSVCHPGWETAFRHGAQTSNPPPNCASQTRCLNVIWGCCRSRHKSAASPSSLRIDEELMEQQVEKVNAWCIFEPWFFCTFFSSYSWIYMAHRIAQHGNDTR